MNIARWIEKHATFAPDSAAIRFADRSISYLAFEAQIEAAAGKLAGLGVRHGQVVAYLGHNSPELLMLLFACARLQAMLVPLNWRLAVPEHMGILLDCRPKVMVVEPEFLDHASVVANDFTETTWLALGDGAPGWRCWREIERQAAASTSDDDNSPLLLCYTSGSTGTPKGVIHTHSSLFWNAMN